MLCVWFFAYIVTTWVIYRLTFRQAMGLFRADSMYHWQDAPAFGGIVIACPVAALFVVLANSV
jgi:hypothetical protein